MTPYIKRLSSRILEEYGYPAKEQIQWFRDYPLRYKDIAFILRCNRMTLRKMCKELDIVPNKLKVIFDRRPIYLNATMYLFQFDNLEDAIVECRWERKLTVEETAKELGVSRSTVIRYTPEWIKGIQHLSLKGLEAKRAGAKKTNAKRKNHPWSTGG